MKRMRDPMKAPCSECGGKLQRKEISQEFEREGMKARLSGLRAWVCADCGEIYFAPGGAERVAQAVNCLFSLALAEGQRKGDLAAQLSSP
jgi:YgiT-type zinc finger domain-containing protein